MSSTGNIGNDNNNNGNNDTNNDNNNCINKNYDYDDGKSNKRSISNNNDNDNGTTAKQKAAKRKKNSRKQKESKDYTWQENDKGIHAGSYAHPDQQKLFNIVIPKHEDNTNTNIKKQKRKVVMLIGYIGINYNGFQMNDKQKTIQSELEYAMFTCNYISYNNFGYPYKYSWSTSGRTDKGVHAAAQVISLKIEILEDNIKKLTDESVLYDTIRNEINNTLPDDIRILDIQRVTRSFCAKTCRDRVRYCYMIPSYIFYNNRIEIQQLLHNKYPMNNNRPLYAPLNIEEIHDIQNIIYNYRINNKQIELLRNVLNKYVGTHSFYNFTRRLNINDAKTNRYIMSFNIEDKVIINNMEWIITTVTGQSFLLNQIRKMICLAIDIVRGVCPIETMHYALLKHRSNNKDNKNTDNNNNNMTMNIATAPAQGLFLDMSFYEQYNIRKERSNNSNPNSIGAPDLDWHIDGTQGNNRWSTFRNEHIIPHIIQEEKQYGNFIQYLYQQEHFNDYNKCYLLDNIIIKNDNNDNSNENDKVRRR